MKTRYLSIFLAMLVVVASIVACSGQTSGSDNSSPRHHRPLPLLPQLPITFLLPIHPADRLPRIFLRPPMIKGVTKRTSLHRPIRFTCSLLPPGSL